MGERAASAVTGRQDDTGGRAVEAIPAGRSAQFLDPRGRSRLEESQFQMLADRHGIDHAGLRPPRRADRFRPAPSRFVREGGR
jgi:hypothetical protein